MVASLVISSRSRRRSSLTSRSSTSAPVRCLASISGIARSDTLAPLEVELRAPGRAAGDHQRQALVDRSTVAEQRR